MSNVNDDDAETLQFADESEWMDEGEITLAHSCDKCHQPAILVDGKWQHAEAADAVFCGLVMQVVHDHPKPLGTSRLQVARDRARDALRAYDDREPAGDATYAHGAWFGANAGRLAEALRNLLDTL